MVGLEWYPCCRLKLQPPDSANQADVCWSFGVVGLEWYPCCRLKLQPPDSANQAASTPLITAHPFGMDKTF